MQTFLGHARERKRGLDGEEQKAASAIDSAWSCLDATEGGGRGGRGGAESGNESSEKDNLFVVLFEFVNKFEREANGD